MPKTLIAQSIEQINPIRFRTEGDTVVGVVLNCEVNYGELGLPTEIDLWSFLSESQQQRAQTLYNLLKNKAEEIILG